jgi:hypothetical protein
MGWGAVSFCGAKRGGLVLGCGLVFLIRGEVVGFG